MWMLKCEFVTLYNLWRLQLSFMLGQLKIHCESHFKVGNAFQFRCFKRCMKDDWYHTANIIGCPPSDITGSQFSKYKHMTHFNAHNRKYVPGKPLAKDFRELIVHKLETQGGDSITRTIPYGCYSLTAKTFSVSEEFVCKIWKLHCNGSGLSPTSRGPVKGANRKLSHEDEEYIQLLVTSNPTIYQSEVCDLLVQHSNAINDINYISLSTIQRTIHNHFGDKTIWTRKKTSCSNDLRWTPENIIYTQQFLNTIQLLNPDDLLFMDESSVHINCGVSMYGSSKKGHHALHFLKHSTGANYTLHLIAGLHGKICYEVITGASNSMTSIN